VAEQNGFLAIFYISPISRPYLAHISLYLPQVAEQNGFLDIFYDGGQMSALLGGEI